MINDKTWEMTIKVRITTMNGWIPEEDDVVDWLDNGDALALVSVEDIKEIKP